MQKALGRFSSLVGRQACSSLGVRGFQATEAAAAPIPIDSEPYCRQRNELVLGTRIPVKAPDAWVAPTAVIIGDVDLYERVSIWYGAVLRGDLNAIRVDCFSNIQDRTVVHAARSSPTGLSAATSIGKYVTIGPSCVLRSCKIEDLCVVGEKSVIMEGSVMMTNSILSPGSVLPPGKLVPSGQLWAGNPAKKVRDLTPDEIADIQIIAEKSFPPMEIHQTEFLPYSTAWRQAQDLREKAGGRETAILTFEYQNGTISTAVAAMGTFGDQPYARELRCSILPYSSLLFDCGDDCDLACRTPKVIKDEVTLPNGLFCLFVTMKGSASCPFYMQALNAQKMGAAAVVLLDDDYVLQIPTYPAVSEAVDGQANVTIPVVSTLKTSYTDTLTSEAVVASLDGKGLPSVVIDFTSFLAQTDKVEVVYFGTERDLCEESMGSYCNRKMEFLRMIAGWMVSLAREGAIRFRYRSLVVSCDNTGGRYCEDDCTNHGRYCVRRPPRGVDTTGADIVKQMAYSECVSQLAELSDEPSLWWDFKLLADRHCTMVTDSLTLECAEEVMRSLDGDARLAGGIGSINICMGNFDDDSENSVLEKAFQDSLGNDQVSEIMFDPTYVINGVQYMGRWSRGAWFEAVCAGFHPGREPDLCLDPEISFDECAPGEYGDELCKLGESSGLTSCRNTFRGFSCECDPSRFITVKNTEDEDATPECRDKNECLTLSLDEDCTCERCACHNTYGGYECEANIPNKCQAPGETAHDQCWSTVINDREYTACVDDIIEYKDKAVRGEIPRWRHGGFQHNTLQSCKCPEGFEGDGVEECTPICKGNPEFFLQGAGCVARQDEVGTAAVIGWIVMSICSVILGLVALKFYTDKRRLARERASREPLLNQKLLGQASPSDTIGVSITPEQSHDDVSSCPPGETELHIIRENIV